MNFNEPDTSNNLLRRIKMVHFNINSKLNDSKISDKRNSKLDTSLMRAKRSRKSVVLKKGDRSFHKKFQIERNNLHSKRHSLEIMQAKTKNMYQRYSIDKNINFNSNHSNEGKHNRSIFLPNKNRASFLQIGQDIKNALNNMKKQLENKKQYLKIRNTTEDKNNKSKVCSSNDLPIFVKRNGRLSLCPPIEKKSIKRKSSFEFTKEASKNLIKRIKSEIKKKSSNNLLKRASSLVDDQFDDSENEIKTKNEKNISFSPNSNFIFIFDIFLIIANLYSFIFIPLRIAKNEELIKQESICVKIIKYLNDIIYLSDFLITLFRGYYNYEMKIIRSNKEIIIHYLKQDFFMDLLEGIPVYIIFNYFADNYFTLFFLKLISFIKSFKIFKVMGNKKNKALEDFYRFLSVYYYLEKICIFIISFVIFFLFIHLFICMHIFFALQDYPNWISYTNNQNERFIKKYITSFYFLMTTMTTVGYGDIVCISFYERIFHIILLGIGTILYSFIVSKIGNYLRDQSYEQMKLSKDLNILESIRLAYPAMPFKLYSKINKHLLNISKKRKKTGISLLINGIPDTIKNELLFKIYSKVINGFIIFKNIENSNFILQILTNFIPIISKKEETLILEGELIDNIIFVKDGKLSLEASINLNDPFNSINQYIRYNFRGISKKQELNNNNIMRINSILTIRNKNYTDLKLEIDNFLLDNQKEINKKNSLNDNNGISMDLGRLNFSINSIEETNIQEGYQLIKIIDIRKNEHFGDIHMFLQKPSPFTIRVKSRKADVLLLRKHDAFAISKAFPNIWKRIYNKSYHNLVSIKHLTFKILKRYYNTYFYNKEKNFSNISNLDVTTVSKLSKRSSGKSDISRVIRKIKTNVKNNNNLNSSDLKVTSNKTNNLNITNLKKQNEDATINDISFSESFKSIKKSNSIIDKNRKMEINRADSNKSKKSGKKPNTNNLYTKNTLSLTKLTFKNDSTLKNCNRESTLINNKTMISKIIQNNSKKNNYEDNSTDKMSNNNSDKNEFLILEDIDKNFAKKIKKKINKRNKIEKIKSLFELQNIKYKNDLIELYTKFFNQNKNLNSNIINISNNLYDFIHKKVISSENKILLSEIFENEEDTLYSSTHRNSQFDKDYLKKETCESFEINSSYTNINDITEGKMIKNLKYKKFLELKIQNCLNNYDFDEKNNRIIEYKINDEILEKNKEDNFKNGGIIEKENSSENKSSLISKSKKINSSLNLSNNQYYSFANVKTLKSIENNTENLNEKPNTKEKSKFQELDSKLKFSSIEPKDKILLSEIQELEKEENLEDKKENKSKFNNKNVKIEKKIINKIRNLNPSKNETENENNNIVLTTSINAINELENDNISKTKIKILNNKDKELMAKSSSPSNNFDEKNKGRCLIF